MRDKFVLQAEERAGVYDKTDYIDWCDWCQHEPCMCDKYYELNEGK